MSCKSCVSTTGVVIINALNMILTLVGLVMIGATGYFFFTVQKMMKVNIYIGLSVGLVTFFFPVLILCGCYKSHCFLVFDNIVLILLSIAECVFVALLWSPESSKKIKELIDLPESYMQFIDSHLSLIMIIAGAIVSVQFLTMIFQGIRASEVKRDTMTIQPLMPDVENRKPNYREKAMEKYDLGKYYDSSSQM